VKHFAPDAPFLADLARGPEGARAAWLTCADGRRIRVAAWPGGDKGTVLLLPGRTEYIEKYGPAAVELAQRGYTTVSIDFRGQGLADRLLPDAIKGHVGAFADYQLDMAAMVDWVQSQGLPQPLFLLAHSMGGSIGLRALIGGLPVKAAAFSAPMWGIRISAVMRPLVGPIAKMLTLLGKSLSYAPTTGPLPYVLKAAFAGNTLTKDRGMWDFMVGHLKASPELALGGPTVQWLQMAVADCADLARQPCPQMPVYCALGTDERIVDAGAIHLRMKTWPGAKFDVIAGAEHEVMMEKPPIRAQFFDAACGLFDAHR
jgi:lysophospholipase